MADTACHLQAVCITDPVLATHVLRSKHVDKLRFKYSFLDPVSPPRPTPDARNLHSSCKAVSLAATMPGATAALWVQMGCSARLPARGSTSGIRQSDSACLTQRVARAVPGGHQSADRAHG